MKKINFQGNINYAKMATPCILKIALLNDEIYLHRIIDKNFKSEE